MKPPSASNVWLAFFSKCASFVPLVRLGGRKLIKLNEWAQYFQILIMGSYFSIYIRIVDTYVTLKLVFVENILAIYFLKLVWFLDSMLSNKTSAPIVPTLHRIREVTSVSVKLA